MSVKRRKTNIDAIDSASQLLVELQLGGHLDGFELPDWAKGTTVEEVVNALEYLGDAKWLDGVYPNLGIQESADKWLEDYLSGEEVVDEDDAEAIRNKASDGGGDTDPENDSKDSGGADEASLPRSLVEYLDSIPTGDAARFNKRFDQEESFRIAATENIRSLGLAIGACYNFDDAMFIRVQSDLTFMDTEAAGDQDLVVMSVFFLIDNYDTILNDLGAEGAQRARAIKRIKVLGANFKKAMAATKA